MKLTKEISDSLNGLARKITDIKTKTHYPITYITFNGSCLPFIGPYWKDVDFTSDYCHVACVEISYSNINKIYVGFNQHLQYEDYPYFTIEGDRWDVIKEAFVGLYKVLHSERPQGNEVDLWLSKIHDNLYEFASSSEIIRD